MTDSEEDRDRVIWINMNQLEDQIFDLKEDIKSIKKDIKSLTNSLIVLQKIYRENNHDI